MEVTEAEPVYYEELAAIEDEFEDVDSEIMRKQHELSKPVYSRRADVVSKIPNFWPLVFEQAPPEIEQFILPQDSEILANHLVNFYVRRHELEERGAEGNPRSVTFRFEFSPNEYFSDAALEKVFWHRRTSDSFGGLVSEPVKIHWKKGKDLTEGLTDAAVALWEARKKVGDMTAKGLPEYTALERMTENLNGSSTSFFTWFGTVSNRRYVTVEEHEKAVKEYKQKRLERLEKAKKLGQQGSEQPAEELEAEVEADNDQAVEIHEAGEELAIAMADELWPSAVKYFTAAQEIGDMSDPEFEEADDDEDDEDGDEPIDIRSLVQDKGKGGSRDSNGPPTKRMKR